MAIIHPLSLLRLRAVVILEASVRPFKLPQAIVFLTEIERAVPGFRFTQMSRHLKGITRKMDSYIRTFYAEVVYLNLPLVFTLSSVHGSRVTQDDVHVGILQLRRIHPQLFSFQVDAVAFQGKFPQCAFHLRVGYKVGSIHLHAFQIQFIHFDLALEKRLQPHIHDHFTDICNGILLKHFTAGSIQLRLDDAHALDA